MLALSAHTYMLIQTWSEVFRISLMGLWYGFVGVFPKILVAIVIFIIGWVFAVTIAKLITAGIDALKLDSLFKSAGVDEALSRANLRLHIGAVVGWLVKWMIVLAFLVASVDLLGLSGVSDFLSAIWFYMPSIFIAVLVLVAGTVLADFVRKIVAGSAAIANVRSANMVGSIAYYAIWILTVVTALDKLGIFGYFGQILFTGIVVTLAIALGLSFGLGGKDAAAKFINKFSDDMNSHK